MHSSVFPFIEIVGLTFLDSTEFIFFEMNLIFLKMMDFISMLTRRFFIQAEEDGVDCMLVSLEQVDASRACEVFCNGGNGAELRFESPGTVGARDVLEVSAMVFDDPLFIGFCLFLATHSLCNRVVLPRASLFGLCLVIFKIQFF
ncbi:hypothetical protein SORBI_3003G283750 [Sorghum bicolor]|uniref:Uncharacterized protein n=1 Tax=Sorghum bicolor TaxID=4558 RepID=A0A1W0VZB6_SORBI|nr:hypothetical protein SORBI_3003G283750 [Sorghum bicolor]OQU87460.1 hypothetical protein SORBI_3003G283750 [Sorghum bicolor]